VAPVAAIAAHGRSVASRIMSATARQFYGRQLRAVAAERRCAEESREAPDAAQSDVDVVA
jgi:hypothetical protein